MRQALQNDPNFAAENNTQHRVHSYRGPELWVHNYINWVVEELKLWASKPKI